MSKFPGQTPLVSIALPAYNEEHYLLRVFDDILQQTYPLHRTELLLINSNSTDATLDIMRDFKERYATLFHRVVLLQNDKRIIPAALNCALREYTGDAFVRIDAHARIPNNFIEVSVASLLEGHDVVGGPRPTISEIDTLKAHMLHSAEESVFGSSISSFRKKAANKPVNSIFHGLYAAYVYDKVGLYNEELLRTEDNDMSERIRRAGFEIWSDSRIISWQYMRPNLKKMLIQKYGNGYWIGYTLHVNPSCVQSYHVVPALFVLALIVSGILALAHISTLPFIALMLLYGVTTVAMSIASSISSSHRSWWFALLPAVFLLLHLSYGIGTIMGWVKGLFQSKRRHA